MGKILQPDPPKNYGTPLYQIGGYFRFTRIPTFINPKEQTSFVITTEGVYIYKGRKYWDPLDWDLIKEPDADNAIRLWGIDISGTLDVRSPKSTIAKKDGEEVIKNVPRLFYDRLLEVRTILSWFPKPKISEISWRERALFIWAKNVYRTSAKERDYILIENLRMPFQENSSFERNEENIRLDREGMIDLICIDRIENELFKGEKETKKEALDLFKRGVLKVDLFLQPRYQCRNSIKEAIEAEKAEKEETKKQKAENEATDNSLQQEREEIGNLESQINRVKRTKISWIPRRYNPEKDRRLN